jgi:hypothetical protein
MGLFNRLGFKCKTDKSDPLESKNFMTSETHHSYLGTLLGNHRTREALLPL